MADVATDTAEQPERIKVRLGREKQFNKRVAINAELREAKQKLQRMRGDDANPE